MEASLAQGKQLLELFSRATSQQVQRVIESSDLIKMMLEVPDLRSVSRDTLRQALRISANPFEGERVASRYGYPTQYAPKPVTNQIRTLSLIYQMFDQRQVEQLAAAWPELPTGAELLQVVPKLASVARLHRISDPYGTGYGKCLEVMLGHIAKSRKLNYREGRLTDRHVRLLEETRETLERLDTETPGDFLVIPMQSGKLYAGGSVQWSRWEIEQARNQWSLPAWVGGHHLLTHPEREVQWEQLHLDCPGDEYSPGAVGGFGRALSFGFGGDGLGFGSSWVADARGGFGSASGFLQE